MKRRRVLYGSLTVLLTVCFMAAGFFIYARSYLRLKEALGDLWASVWYFFAWLIRRPEKVTPTVTRYSTVIGGNNAGTFASLKKRAAVYIRLLFSRENLSSWLFDLRIKGIYTGQKLSRVLPFLLLVVVLIRQMYAGENNRTNRDTLPLKIYKLTVERVYLETKNFVVGYIGFLRERRYVMRVWLLLWSMHLNLASVIVEFFAFYLILGSFFKVSVFSVQVVKLYLDTKTCLGYLPWWVYPTAGIYLFGKFREKLGLAKLRHWEARNCGFINELPIVSITCGSMGKKKTTMITDMALSQEVMFRQKAFEILQKKDMQFPDFPWICFEKELLTCIEHGTVWNLATVREWVGKKRSRYEKRGDDKRQLYGYESGTRGMVSDDGLKRRHLFDVLETYAQAYFIYVMQTSLIVSNYSIRTDNKMMSAGNFPLWSTDFFSCGKRECRHAHILDFDVLRLGKKVSENNPKAGSFEFGVVVITEIGKERGNNLELKEVRKKNEEANQKNDLFNSWLKMCRHSATVDNYPFIKVFTDEQRPESWGADARDLCDIVRILSAGETKLALPFYTIGEMVSEWAYRRFLSLYYDFRYRRGDNTLLVHLLKAGTARLRMHNERIYNKFGYSVLKIGKERGTMDGKPVQKRYYLIHRKIYAGRFTTDCFSDFFQSGRRRAKRRWRTMPSTRRRKRPSRN